MKSDDLNRELCELLNIQPTSISWVAHLGTPGSYTSVFADTEAGLSAAIAKSRQDALSHLNFELGPEFNRYELKKFPDLQADLSSLLIMAAKRGTVIIESSGGDDYRPNPVFSVRFGFVDSEWMEDPGLALATAMLEELRLIKQHEVKSA